MSTISELYNNPRYGFLSAARFKKKLDGMNSDGGRVTHDDVQHALRHEPAQQIHQQRKKPAFAPILAEHGTFQADLMFYIKEAGSNSGYIGILCIVEIRTRMAYVYPIKSKRMEEMVELFGEFWDDLKRDKKDVTRIEVDGGGEFVNWKVKQWFNEHGITMTVVDPHDVPKKGIVERFNQTLRNLIEKYLSTKAHPRWIDALEDLAYNYNHTVHRTIKTTPASVTVAQEDDIARMIASKNKAVPEHSQFHVGDQVRLQEMSKHDDKDRFVKGRERWSRQIYEVTRIDKYQIFVRPYANGAATKELPIGLKHHELQKIPKGIEQTALLHPKVKREYETQRQARALNAEGIFDNLKEARKAIDTQPIETVNLTGETEIRKGTRARATTKRLNIGSTQGRTYD